MKQPKLWTKDFIIISLTNFFTHIVFYMLMVTIAMYVSTKFHLSQSIAGLATGIFVLASLMARIFAGKYMDSIGRKRVLIGSLIIFVMAMFLHLWANSLVFLLIIRFIHGAAHGLVTTAAGAIAADLIPDERRGEGTGYYATSMNLAMAVGPFIGIFISVHGSFQMIFLIGSIVALIDLIVTLFVKVLEIDLSEKELKNPAGFNWRDFMETRALPISVAVFSITLAYTSLLSFLSLYAKEIDLVGVSSFFFIVYAIALLALRPFTGVWFDKFGENRVTYPLIICLAIGFLFLSQTHNGILFLVAGALIGIGYGTLLSNFQAIAIQQSQPNRKALATSTFFIMLDLANAIGPYLMGILIGFMSFRHLYLNMTIWIIICMGIYYVAHGKKAAIQRVV
ncbi:MAG: MFS transporter [Bacillota bacterium]|nr:MFS transporter [Bacillota bacterium]